MSGFIREEQQFLGNIHKSSGWEHVGKHLLLYIQHRFFQELNCSKNVTIFNFQEVVYLLKILRVITVQFELFSFLMRGLTSRSRIPFHLLRPPKALNDGPTLVLLPQGDQEWFLVIINSFQLNKCILSMWPSFKVLQNQVYVTISCHCESLCYICSLVSYKFRYRISVAGVCPMVFAVTPFSCCCH